MKFKITKNPTNYGYFDADYQFQLEADNFINFVMRRLGNEVVSAELTRTTMWSQLESAVVKWSNIVNEFQITDYMADLIGKPRPLEAPVNPGDVENIANDLIRPNLDFVDMRAYAFSSSAGLGGDYSVKRAIMMLESGKQVYDLKTDLFDASDIDADPLPIMWESPENKEGHRMKIMNVMHYDNEYFNKAAYPRLAASQFLTAQGNGQYGANMFRFMLPIFDDVVRLQFLRESSKVRRSAFSWKIVGTNFYVYPSPRSRMYFRPIVMDVAFVPGVTFNGLEGENPNDSILKETYTYKGTVITNISNIPYGLFEFSSINSIGREWIREYALALCKEILGLTRGKFSSFPIPSDTLTLNSSDLLSQAQTEKENLETKLRERLEQLSVRAVLERKSQEAEFMRKTQDSVPPRKPFHIA